MGEKTLRLVMPQWQGGGLPAYILGARLLAWLAPASDALVREVPVASPGDGALALEQGVYARSAILRQDQEALRIIQEVAPDRIVTFGGDCSVSLAPFSYLASRYAGDVAILWIDSHTDFAGPDSYPYAHGYPVNNLLGYGDPEFVAFVTDPVPANRLAYVGIQKRVYADLPLFTELGATAFDPAELTEGFSEITAWIRETGAAHLLVHFDLDVLDPGRFRAQHVGHPDGPEERYRDLPSGQITLDQVTSLVLASGEAAHIAALSITEHLPWDAQHLQHALARIPILR
jgi:arginase